MSERDERLRLITWNLNGRKRVGEQVEALASADPDIVALQEVKSARIDELVERLSATGFSTIAHTMDLTARSESKARSTAVLIASRQERVAPEATLEIPWPEKALSVGCDSTPKRSSTSTPSTSRPARPTAGSRSRPSRGSIDRWRPRRSGPASCAATFYEKLGGVSRLNARVKDVDSGAVVSER